MDRFLSFLPRYWVSFRPASASALLVVVSLCRVGSSGVSGSSVAQPGMKSSLECGSL